MLSSALIRPWSAAVAVIFSAARLMAADPVPSRIEASEPRVQIRTEILKGTALGSSPAEVIAFIRSHFVPNEGAPALQIRDHPAVGSTAQESPRKGVQSIRLVLGHYVKNPALFLMEIPLIAQTTTTVQWAFDKDGKLIEVFVDKSSELGE